MSSYKRVTKTVRAATAAVALTGLLGLGACAAADRTPGSAAGTSTAPAGHVVPGAALDALAQRDVDAGAPGVVIRIDDGRRPPVTVAKQADWTRADHRLSADDQFRMGSNTKTMVATVALQLVAEHRLKLTDPVEKWLPGAVANGQKITVRMLLNHTSGLPDYFFDLERGRFDTDVLNAVTGKVQRTWTPRRLLATAAKYPVLFAPGTNYSYSNTNYVAVGLILERVTGDSVSHLLRSRILRPLGLNDAYLATDGRSRDGDHLAHGYEPDAANVTPILKKFGTPAGTQFYGPARPGHVDVTGYDPTYTWAAGAMIATPRDWDRFLSALLSGRLLPKAQLAQMRTTVVDPTSQGTVRYGLGLMTYTNRCGTVWGHTGGIPGFGSQNYTDATGQKTVSVVTTTQFGAKTDAIAVADQRVVDAAVCTMLGKPIPAN